MNLHGPVRAAEFEGTATVVLALDAWPEGKVAKTVHRVTVLPPKATKVEPVTALLTKTLPHPDRKATVGVVRFSPDGKRLLGAGYPSGVVQIWDTQTWAETVRIDTPSGLRATMEYALPLPDWSAVLVHSRTRKVVKEEKGGKVTERLQIDGRIDLHDPATGKRVDSIPLPDRGPQQVWLTPDGKAAVANMEGSFTAADRDRPGSVEWIDLGAKTATRLFDDFAQPALAPDGRMAFVSLSTFKASGAIEGGLVRYDLTKRAVVATKEQPTPDTYFARPTLSPDGKRLVVLASRFAKNKFEDYALTILDPDTFAEKGRITGEPKADAQIGFDPPLFTPDGKTLATRLGNKVFVWDVAADKLVRTVPIADIGFGRSALSPDGKTLAVAGLPPFDVRSVGRDPDPLDLPQPRVVLVDLDDPKADPRTLTLPHGAAVGLAFRPDGKRLAVGGTGGVYLLDVSGTVSK